jgi:hypothetical protein
MNNKQLSLAGVAMAIFSTLAVLPGLPAQAQATGSSVPQISFVPPTNDKIPQSRGGASRPAMIKCYHDSAYSQPMKSLVPTSQQGLTISDHPTFWVYIPQTEAASLYLAIKTLDDRGVYQTQFPLNHSGGIMAVTLPEEAPALQVGEIYTWSIALLCNSPQVDIPFVGGYVRRVDLSLTPESSTDLLQQAAAYGQAGVWYDTLTRLAELKQTQPNNPAVTENWVSVLASVDLNEMVQQPFLQP